MSSILEAYLENEAAIKRFLKRFIKRSEDIDDLAQETFIRAFAAESAQTVKFPKAFLFRIARNLALNEREKCSNAKTDSLEDFADQAVLEDHSEAAPDDKMEFRERVRLLAQAVASLPPQCSKVFLLRKVYGYSYKSIAYRLNISVSTAEKHVALGLLRCSEYLRRQGYDIDTKSSHLTKAHRGGKAPNGVVTRLGVNPRKRVRDA
ncbi:MAG TPA: RNA polymerase sigma factor [Rhizomicrobium sp.]